MRQDVETLSSRIDVAKQLCNKVLEFGERIKRLSPDEIGMEAYAEEITQITEDRGRATRAAIKELNLINVFFAKIGGDSTASIKEKAFLTEKINSVQTLSPLLSQQNFVIQRSIEKHLTGMRKEAVDFHKKVGVIKTYLKTPDRRTFYGTT